jgi:hypothetical protein
MAAFVALPSGKKCYKKIMPPVRMKRRAHSKLEDFEPPKARLVSLYFLKRNCIERSVFVVTLVAL